MAALQFAAMKDNRNEINLESEEKMKSKRNGNRICYQGRDYLEGEEGEKRRGEERRGEKRGEEE